MKERPWSRLQIKMLKSLKSVLLNLRANVHLGLHKIKLLRLGKAEGVLSVAFYLHGGCVLLSTKVQISQF